MSSSTFILCPGQGAQVVGMGKDFYEISKHARETFDAANDVVGFDLKSICFGGPEERLNQTDVSQPAIYVTSIACYRAAVAAGKIDPAVVTAYAGLSLGEYTALHLAGVFTFEDGLRLVTARGKYMQEAAVATPSGWSRSWAPTRPRSTSCAPRARRARRSSLQISTLPDRSWSAARKARASAFSPAAEAAGFKAVALKVAGAFHSPLMQSGADRMKAELDKAAFSKPTTTVYSNVTAKPHDDPRTIKELLVKQIVSPVRWEQTMTPLAGVEGARFVELAPGRTLAGLMKRINRRLPVESFATTESLGTPA
jgi:[acyl-carrier-protein] S-malonyltransferase